LTTRNQLIIDNFIAKPIAFFLNFLVRFVGKILIIDHSLNRPFKRIVVCKFKGLGSIIQATPMLQALKQTYPDATITFLTTRSNTELLEQVDIIDRIIVVDDSTNWRLFKSLFTSIIKLLWHRPEVYIDLEIYSNFSSLVTISSLAKNRIGFYLRSSSFKMGIYTHMMYYNTNVPISEVYMQIVRLMNPNVKSPSLFNFQKNFNIINPIEISNYIVINPNASDLRKERMWDGQKFRDLGSWLCSTFPNKTIIYVGSPSEQEYVNDLLKGLSFGNLKNLAGKTSIKELIQIIHGAELVITNDTGPMHISFACATPTFALFGPCSPIQFGRQLNAKIIYNRVYCSPCVHEFLTPPCNGNNICMQLISLERVINEVEMFYRNNQQFSGEDGNYSSIDYFSKGDVLGLVNRKLIEE
jgi:ADP-heptose:LPS heptosyltransferase